MYKDYILLIPGVLLLLLGRRLFWLSVAALGFLLGAELAAAVFPHQSQVVVLAVEICMGILGAVLAIMVQEIMISVAGFFLGGHLAMLLAPSLAFYNSHYWWIAFLAGGIVGAIVMVNFFDWALIILSSFLGAHLIMDALVLKNSVKLIGFFVLALLGILAQSALLGKGKSGKT